MLPATYSGFGDELLKIAKSKSFLEKAIGDVERDVRKNTVKLEDEKRLPALTRKLLKDSPVEVRVTKDYKKTNIANGAYSLLGKHTIVVNTTNPETLAHELGHSDWHQTLPGKVTQFPLLYGSLFLAPLAAAIAGAAARGPNTSDRAKNMAMVLPLAAALPAMVSEAVASTKGYSRLSALNASKEQLREYKRKMLGAYLTYAAIPAMTGGVGLAARYM